MLGELTLLELKVSKVEIKDAFCVTFEVIRVTLKMSKFIELSLYETSEKILVDISSIVLIEVKAIEHGGFVSITTKCGKEFGVIEDYSDIRSNLEIITNCIT